MKRFDASLAFIIFVAAVLRLLFLLKHPFTNSDGVLYAWIGGNLADGYGYTIAEGISLSDSRAWHVPGYPVMLALFYKLLGRGLIASKLPAFIFGVMTVVLLYRMCLRLFDRGVALMASLLLAIHPQFIFFSAEVMAESMYVFFLTLFIYLIVRNPPSTSGNYLITGIVAGLCYLMRTAGILTIPLFVLYHLYVHRSSALKRFGLFLGGFLLMAVPWWLWSRLEYGAAFSAEQNTLIQMYQYEFGHFAGYNLNFFTYFIGKHEPTAILSGFLDGANKILYATLIPRILYFNGIEYVALVQLPFLALIAYVLGYGARWLWENSRLTTLIFFGAVITNLLGHAWGVHVIPPDSATIFRYTLPAVPVFIIVLSLGVKALFERGGHHKTVSIACLLLVVFSALAVTQSNYQFNHAWSDSVYERSLAGLSREVPILASNIEKVRFLGFKDAHEVGLKNFSQILDVANEKNIRYILVDTSSIYNDHQFYLVNHWYRERIPDSIQKISEDTFPVTVYEIVTEET